MDDFGVWIYLIGLIAYYAYRGFMKKKNPQKKPVPKQKRPTVTYEKKTQPQPEYSPEPAPKATIEDIFREVLQMDMPPTSKPEVIKPRPLVEAAMKVESKPVGKRKPLEITKVLMEKKKKPKRTPFDLRSAIIQQAILERPYK